MEHCQRRACPLSFQGSSSEYESLAQFHMWPTCSYTPHLEVMKDKALLLYGIKKSLKINVGGWIHSNIRHAI